MTDYCTMALTKNVLCFYAAHPWIPWLKITLGPSLMVLGLFLIGSRTRSLGRFAPTMGFILFMGGGLIFLGR